MLIHQTATIERVSPEYHQYHCSCSAKPMRGELGGHLEHHMDHLIKISSGQHTFASWSGVATFDVIIWVRKPGDEVVIGGR